MSWTDEKVQKLRELWSKGHTASQIAEALGDTTRNAVIGKAHRLNLEARAPSKQSNSPRAGENKQVRRGPVPTSRKAKFQSILLDKNFDHVLDAVVRLHREGLHDSGCPVHPPPVHRHRSDVRCLRPRCDLLHP